VLVRKALNYTIPVNLRRIPNRVSFEQQVDGIATEQQVDGIATAPHPASGNQRNLNKKVTLSHAEEALCLVVAGRRVQAGRPPLVHAAGRFLSIICPRPFRPAGV
jgi:hypothetical protein